MRSSRRLRFLQCLLSPAGMSLATALIVAVSSIGLAAASGQSGTPEHRLAVLQAMTLEQRVRFGQALAAWNALPRDQREDRRARYQAWRQLDETERVRLRALAAQVDAYPAERRQALRLQFDALDDVQRLGWRLGPALGQQYPLLHPLLAYVPQAQRTPLLSRLGAMSPEQRDALALLAQRTPPQDRDALRNELLAIPATGVASWLDRRLGQ